MGKIRVYELARKLEMESKELVNLLQELGIDISSHMSTVEDETAQLVKDMVSDKSEETDEEETDHQETKETNLHKNKKTKGKKDSKQEGNKYIIEPPITVKDFSEEIDYPANKIIKILMESGVMANLNHSLDEDILNLLQEKLNVNINFKPVSEKEEKKVKEESQRVGPEIQENPEELELRPPIVTIMGHVDHGKTTLLDVIRKASVADNEAGGITQHIGAYQAVVNDKKITFIDTPGHEAFTAMRARGAQITDIAILVIGADDGVMPQTTEAINHAKSADIPIIVAINKIDKPNAQPERVKQELTEHDIVPEEWGGDTICVSLSALKGENIDELLEMVLLVSEMEEIKANPDRQADGVIIEAELDKGRGPVATILVKNGTLEVSDSLLAGTTYGRVRAMLNERGERIEKALPSTPVEVLGFSDVPSAGDFVQVLEDEKKARNIAEERQEEKHRQQIQQDTNVSLENLYDQIQEGEIKEFNVIIKAEV
ncbi:MAG: translation initiation factor IF-2, partial [Halanaerobiales bacterium]|nr:translation initiation factor IF-2 [Halanaerobiales bacterium]